MYSFPRKKGTFRSSRKRRKKRITSAVRKQLMWEERAGPLFALWRSLEGGEENESPFLCVNGNMPVTKKKRREP